MEKRSESRVTLETMLTTAGGKPILLFNWGPSALVLISKITPSGKFGYSNTSDLTGYELMDMFERLGLSSTLDIDLKEVNNGAELIKEFKKATKVNLFFKLMVMGMYITVGGFIGILIGTFLASVGDLSLMELMEFIKQLISL